MNPVFQQTFRFEVGITPRIIVLLALHKKNEQVSLEEVVKKTLVLQVFDWDLITGDDDIGEVRMAGKILLNDNKPIIFRSEYPWQILTSRMGQTNGLRLKS